MESGFVPKDLRSGVIVPLYKCKGEMTEFKNYRDISLLSVVSKIYIGILVDKVEIAWALECIRFDFVW